MRGRILNYALAFVTTAFILVSVASLTAETQTDAKALFEAKCSTCHGLDRPTSKKKSKEEWEKTVLRMKSKPKASITDEEATKIIDYLATHYGR